nr:hypothetical protein [Tanacetum cinerariifolium]
MEIRKLKRRVKKLERKNKVRKLKFRRLQRVGTSQRVETSDETVLDDVSNQGRMIAKMDQDDAVVLEYDKEKDREVADAVKDVEEAKDDKSAQDQVRQAESQAEIYKIDMDHANKVLSMHEDDTEPAEVQEVVDVVTTTKLITEVVTAASETITAAIAAVPIRRRKGVVIRDPEEESTTSIIIPAKTKSNDKGKGILVEEPKPLKKKQQIKQDEQYARELHTEQNKDIYWDEAIDHVKRKAKEDPAIKRYQVNRFVTTTLIDFYVNCGFLEFALRVFDELPKKNVFCYNATLRGFATHGYGREALGLFKKIRSKGLAHGDVTMVVVISAFSHVGLVDEGCRARRVNESIEVLQTMPRRILKDYGIDKVPRTSVLELADAFLELTEEPEEDPEMEEEEMDIEDEMDDPEIIDPYEIEKSELPPPPADSNTSSDFEPEVEAEDEDGDDATVGTITRAPYSVPPFSGTIYVGSGSSRKVFVPDPIRKDVDILHRKVKGLAQQMFDRANTKYSTLKRLGEMDRYLGGISTERRSEAREHHKLKQSVSTLEGQMRGLMLEDKKEKERKTSKPFIVFENRRISSWASLEVVEVDVGYYSGDLKGFAGKKQRKKVGDLQLGIFGGSGVDVGYYSGDLKGFAGKKRRKRAVCNLGGKRSVQGVYSILKRGGNRHKL